MANARTSTDGSAKDRVISDFPPALFPAASPYKQFSFNARLNAQRAGLSNMRTGKVVVVGDIAVGKTSLITRFCRNAYEADYKATIGVDFEVEKFSILSNPFSLNIWDTAGHERFKCIAASYYRGANVVLVVFSMSDISTLRSTVQWKQEACTNSETDLKEQFIFLVGTKRDLLSDGSCRDVEEEALKVASELNAEYWTVSSKTGQNVKELFFRMAALSFDQTVSKEMQIYRDEPKKVGSDLIRVRQSTREEEDAWKKMKSKIKCCK